MKMATGLFRRRLPAIIKTNLHTTSTAGSGYIVLIPETPSESSDTNPLLKNDNLLDLSGLTTDQCVGAIRKLTLDYESGMWKVEEKLGNGNMNFHGSVLPTLENLGNPLDSAWSVAKVLYLCGGSPEVPSTTYEKLHHAARSAKGKRFFSQKIHSSALQTFTALGKSKKSQPQRTDEQALQRVVGKYVLEGRLNGLELEDEEKQLRFRKIRNQLVEETSRFNKKLNVATQLFQHNITDPNLVRDFPMDLLEEMAVDRSQPNRGPWCVTLTGGVAPRFIEHCPDPSLRWNVWQASVRRASVHGPPKAANVSIFDSLKGKRGPTLEDLNNSTHVEKIRDLRKELANMLGFENAAVMSMETKMARSIESVRSMTASLLLKAKPAQEKELSSLHEFAQERGHPPSAPLEIWDIPYWRRKFIRSSLGLEEDGLRAFFPLERVLDGLFRLCGRLFSLQIEPLPLPMKGATAWHPDVRLYAVNDASSGETLGAFYLDPWVRPGSKFCSSEVPGWMIGIRNRSAENIPLSALIFNFPMPSDKRPCLLSPREVHSLFLKFGHALQHLLCRAKNSEVFGLNNVEWDAVDVCSNFMSLWLTDVKTLKDISGHCTTGEPISEDIAKILATESQQLAGYDLCKELYLSDLDLELHTSNEFWLDIVRQLWPVYFCVPLDKQDGHVCSFRAAFESGSSGGSYFSRLWSFMVASDIFDAFLEEVNPASSEDSRLEAAEKVGARFRSTYLTLGGACHPGEVFRQFRGRDPSPSALLCSLGLKAKKHH